jgi:fatty acid synthase
LIENVYLILDLSLLGGNKTFHGILLDTLNGTKEEEKSLIKHKKLVNHLVKTGIENGVVKPLPRTVFEKEEVEKAFRYMSSGKHKGIVRKLVVKKLILIQINLKIVSIL